jgi:CheY-like chemotaxis protein
MARILIVEDSPTQAKQIQLMLEEAGHHAEVAKNGVAALEIIRRIPPDLVVTDLEMPHMNGLELVEAVHAEHAAVPVILMTAHGSEEIAALALRKGAASYVPKAYLESDLVVTVERTLAVTQVDRHHHRALECLAEMDSHFVLLNDPDLIIPIIGHLEEALIRLNLCDGTERMRVGVALHEALLNAMYHGNLEVGSELRQLGEQPFQERIKQRQQQSPYWTRRVHLFVKVTIGQAQYVVRDEGPGFDPSILPDPTDPANLERVGGRGLLLIRTFMDQVHHNELGNEITMIKRRG